MKPSEFLSRLDEKKIVEAIGRAEKLTSGEIRVFVSRHEPADPLAAAQDHFDKMGMQKTKQRNGVLIFVAPRARKFAVVGDSGVHARCGNEFWQALAAEMSGHFKKEAFTDGIVHAINKAGELLAQHFPRQRGDTNELSDQVAHD